MQYRRLGSSDLMVSVLGLGTTGWGAHREFGDVDAGGAARQVAMALDAGVNLFDTAETYGNGRCEEVLGEALGPRRDEAVIATKTFFGNGGEPDGVGLSARNILYSCEGSLRRLRTDRIDLLQMHGWDGTVPLEDTLSALETLVRDGKVRYVGVSNWSGWHLMKALGISEREGLPRFVSQQIYYSLQAREAEFELVPIALDQGVGILVWSPLGGALLTGRWRRGSAPPAGTRRVLGWPDPPIYDEERLWSTVDVLVEIAEARGCAVPQVALAYLLHKPGVVSLVIGARNETQLAEDLPAADLVLETEEIRRLDDASAPPLPYPYWWQAKYDERLGEADLALLGRYQDMPIPEGGLHRPLPGFDVVPGGRPAEELTRNGEEDGTMTDTVEDFTIAQRLSPDARPSWSDVTSAGVFRVEPNGRFDRHYHDCDEYWLVFAGRARVLVGSRTYIVGPGDIVCTPTGTEHDVVAVAETLEAFWFEAATPPGGRIGHLHRTEEDARGHDVPALSEAPSG